MRALTILACAGLIGTAQTAAAQDPVEGADLYLHHCAMCHGADAQGGGPLAPALTLQPPDLTQITARNDGVFPMIRTVMRIDGREPLVSHGSPMPVFGELFDEEVQEVPLRAETGQPMLVPRPIADVVTFLQEIQQ